MRVTIIFGVLLLTSCATKFSKEQNCSSQALAFLENPGENITDQTAEKQRVIINSVFANLSPEFGRCYQEDLEKRDFAVDHHVCLVASISAKGKLSFLDIEDRVSPISSDLRDCLAKLIKPSDFKEGLGHEIRLVQPINFTAKRKAIR